MPKLVLMPPLDRRRQEWLPRLREALPGYEIDAPSSDEEARVAVRDADAAYGAVPLDSLKTANKLRWIQSAQAAPPAGYYYKELIDHPAIVCNPRGVFSDHIGQHIMMYVLGLARDLPYSMDAQRKHEWDKRGSNTIDLSEATALIVGVGGIGTEAARLCSAFGMKVVGVDGRWEQEPPASVERHQLVVQLDESVDRALLERMLSIVDSEGDEVAGEVTAGEGADSWIFIPDEAWKPGTYMLRADVRLEDRAGNRLDGLFDQEIGDSTDTKPQDPFVFPPFTIE